MNRSSLFILSLGVTLFVFVSTTNAQYTITIPKLPKIKREKPVTVATETPTPTVTTTQSTDSTPAADTSSTESSSASSSGGGTSWWNTYQIGEIEKLKKQFDEWDPETHYFPASITNDDYTGLALSKTARAAWLKDHKVGPDPKLEAAFESLKASVLKRIPENKVKPAAYAFHNVAEERMLVANMSDVPGIKIFKTGFSEASWLIDKNDYGIPTARFKHGAVYGRNPASEDPFCRLWLINIIQDYSGGGTYGASRARYIDKSYVACPAGM